MSQNDDEAVWQEYIDNYSRAFTGGENGQINASNSNSSSTSSSNTIMNSTGPTIISMDDLSNNSRIRSNASNTLYVNHSVSPMSDPFSSGDSFDPTNSRSCQQRSPQVELLSALFPLPTSSTDQYADNNNSQGDNDFTDNEAHVIARLQRLMNSRNFDASEHSPQVTNAAYNLSTDITIASGSEDDSLDQYLESYRQSVSASAERAEQQENGQTSSSSSIVGHSNSTFNLADEWRKLSQPRNNNNVSEFMSDLSFGPFPQSMETLYTTSSSSTSPASVPATSTMFENFSGKLIRSNLSRLNIGLTRCEEKAETVQQMLEHLQGALRSRNAVSVSSFTDRCLELSQRLDGMGATTTMQQQPHHYNNNNSLESSEEDDRTLNYTIDDDAEYAQWNTETSMSNEAYLNFGFEYDSGDGAELGEIIESAQTNHYHHQQYPAMAVVDTLDSGSFHNNRNNQRRVTGRQVGLSNNFVSRDLSPATRQFYISIGCPVDGQAPDVNCIMVPDNPRSFPRNLLGDETPVPFFNGNLSNDQAEVEDQAVENDLLNPVAVPPSVPDSGVGSDTDDASSAEEDSGIGMEESMSSLNPLNSTNNTNAAKTEENTDCAINSSQVKPPHLIDLENISDTLWEKGIIPPAIDVSDFETDLGHNDNIFKKNKVSDEDIAEIQKMVTEELQKNCSLSCDGDEEECELHDDADEKQVESCPDSDTEVESKKSVYEDNEVSEIESILSQDKEFSRAVSGQEGEDEYGDSKSQQIVVSESEKYSTEVEEDKSQTVEEETSREDDESTIVSDYDDKSSSAGELESRAGGDTSCELEYVSPSASKISGFKAGLKSLKVKMCGCFANSQKCRLHSPHAAAATTMTTTNRNLNSATNNLI